MIRNKLTTLGIAFSVLVFTGFSDHSIAYGQAKSQVQSMTGEVVSLEKKGRTHILRVKNKEGEEKDFTVTPKVKFEVKAKGGLDMLTNGFFVTGTVTKPSDAIIAESLSVYPDLKGRLPAGKFVKAPMKLGQSKSAYLVSGKITGREDDAQFAGYEALTITLVGRKTARILINKSTRVDVRLTDMSAVEPGAPVTMEGIPFRSGHVNLVSVVVTSQKSVKPEDFQTDDKKSR